MLKSAARPILFNMGRTRGIVLLLACALAACSDSRNGEPRPSAEVRPPNGKPSANDVGPIEFANDCLIMFDPGDSRVLASVLVRGKYRRPDGRQFEDLTVYNLMCFETDGWACSGAKLNLGHVDNAGAERVIGFGQIGSIVGAKVISAQDGFAVISWGVNTITIDAVKGTFEHHDSSGSGVATCASPLDRHRTPSP